MKTRLFAVVMIIVVIGGGFAVYLSLKTDGNSSETAASSRAERAANSGVRADAYVDYDPNVIQTTPGTKLLFFDSATSTQSQLLDKDIASADIPDGITVIKVDYDSNKPLLQKYSVITDATIVRIDNKGNMTGKFVAYDNPTFAAVRQHLLSK